MSGAAVHPALSGHLEASMRFIRLRYSCQVLSLLVALVIAAMGGVSMRCAADPLSVVEVIVNPGVQHESLSVGRLRVIFSMRVTRWADSQPIHVFVLPGDHPLHQRFVKNVLKLFPHQLQSAWDRMVYSGTGVAPTIVASVEEMRAKIASTPGAIGYIDKRGANE
jgi:ABC-type phosphate transport system substrate-binding protein